MHTAKPSICTLMLLVTAMMSACGGNGSGSSNSGGGGNNNPPTNIVYTFSGGLPTAIATQIGTGSWTAATPPTSNNQFTVSVPSGTTNYGLAYFCPAPLSGWVNQEQVIEATVSDGTAFTVPCNPTKMGIASGTVNFSGSPFPNLDYVYVYGSQNTLTAAPSTGPPTPQVPFKLSAPNGSNDIAVVGVTEPLQTLAIKIFRNQTVPGQVNGGNAITFAMTDAPGSRPYTITGLPSGFSNPSVFSFYTTANGTSFNIGGSTATQYTVMPAGQSQSGDFYSLEATATENQSGQDRGVVRYVNLASPGSMSFMLPAPLAYAAPAAAAWPTFTVNYSGFSGTTASDISVGVFWSTATSLNDVAVTATSAYLNGTTTLAIPDLTSLTGFLQAPSKGTTIAWLEEVAGGDYHVFSATPSTGSMQEAYCQGEYTEP